MAIATLLLSILFERISFGNPGFLEFTNNSLNCPISYHTLPSARITGMSQYYTQHPFPFLVATILFFAFLQAWRKLS